MSTSPTWVSTNCKFIWGAREEALSPPARAPTPGAEALLTPPFIQHIGLSIPYARKFLTHPGVSFNLFYPILSDSEGARFVKDARAAGRNVYAWTVNDEHTMRYGTIR